MRLIVTPHLHLFVGVRPRQHSRKCLGVHAEGGGNGKPAAISEDLIARLKAAEAEAQRLKKELADAKAHAAAEIGVVESQPPVPATKRIDSGDMRRETLAVVESKERNWLQETDMDFFIGGGPSETDGSTAGEEEEGAIVQRRLLIGLALTAAVGAFALVPTEKLQAPPSKPLFFYLVPLVRVQGLLDQVERIIPDGDYDQLQSVLARIQGAPNNVQDNLRSAAASLSSASQADAAEKVARDVYEYLRGIDYQTYYDSPSSRGGKAQQQLVDFSLRSAGAAKRTLAEFLALMPTDQLEAAQQQVATSPF